MQSTIKTKFFELIKKTLYLTYIILSIISPSVTPKNQDNEQNILKLKQLLDSFVTLQANFNQKNSQTKQITTGIMKIKKPNFFRWQITHPFSQIIIYNHKKIWNYDASLAQLTISNLNEQKNALPIEILNGNIEHLSKDYLLTIQSKKLQQIFIFNSKNNNNLFKQIKIIFHQQNLKKIILNDTFDNYNSITFSQVIKNPAIKDNLFVLSPPKGTDIIDETQNIQDYNP